MFDLEARVGQLLSPNGGEEFRAKVLATRRACTMSWEHLRWHQAGLAWGVMVYMHTHLHTHAHTHTHTRTHTQTHTTHKHTAHAISHVHLHTHMDTHTHPILTSLPTKYVIHVYIQYTCTCTCIHLPYTHAHSHTCTESGRVAILVQREAYISLAMSSAVSPMDPTKSGRPHEPIIRVSPVNAYTIEV